MRLLAARTLAALCLLAPVALAADDRPAATGRPNLSGAWSINKNLGTAPGSVGMPDDGMSGDGMRGPGGGGGMGGPGGGGPGGGGGGGLRGGMGGGGRGRPGGGGGRPREEDMAARRALVQELMELPARVTIAQDGDKLTFIEPDGVVRTYVASDKVEKHQLTNGTIETKSRWDKGAFVMELKPTGGMKITRTFVVKETPRQLEVTTTFDRGPKDIKRVTIYEAGENVPATEPESVRPRR